MVWPTFSIGEQTFHVIRYIPSNWIQRKFPNFNFQMFPVHVIERNPSCICTYKLRLTPLDFQFLLKSINWIFKWFCKWYTILLTDNSKGDEFYTPESRLFWSLAPGEGFLELMDVPDTFGLCCLFLETATTIKIKHIQMTYKQHPKNQTH